MMSMVRYKYNDERDPPAPFVYVTMSGIDGTTSEKRIPAQVDSGADRTVIPLAVANELGLLKVRDLLIGGFGGSSIALPTFLIQLRVHDFAPLQIEVIGAPDESFALLGRDVLNLYRCLHDGPAKAFEIE
jgi:hypothetical protein